MVRERHHRMIVYDPPEDLRLPPGARIRKRELASFVAEVAAGLSLEGAVSVLLASDGQIRELNRRFRKKDKATDVLSFPAESRPRANGDAKSKVAGDLAISVETAVRQAAEMGHSLEAELKILLLHGLLHLAGLDHETDTGEMRRKENRLRRRFGLPVTLIERSSHPAAKTLTSPRVAAARSGTTSRPRTASIAQGKRKSDASVGTATQRRKAGSPKPGPRKAGSPKPGPRKAGSPKPGPRKAGPRKAGPRKAGPRKAGQQ